ncbi:MAG: hypothetical protein ACRCYD_10640, partial [Plesiomonas sp.]
NPVMPTKNSLKTSLYGWFFFFDCVLHRGMMVKLPSPAIVAICHLTEYIFQNRSKHATRIVSMPLKY